MYQRFRHLCCDEGGATAVEYAVLLALILMGVIGAIGAFGGQTGGMWGGVESNLSSTRFGGP